MAPENFPPAITILEPLHGEDYLPAHVVTVLSGVATDREDGALEGAATVVNTTSLGMVGQPPLDLRLDALGPDAVVADIIYTPLETPLVEAARARGNAAVGGLGMLIHQGPPAWKLWFGLEPKVTDELRSMMEESILGDR